MNKLSTVLVPLTYIELVIGRKQTKKFLQINCVLQKETNINVENNYFLKKKKKRIREKILCKVLFYQFSSVTEKCDFGEGGRWNLLRSFLGCLADQKIVQVHLVSTVTLELCNTGLEVSGCHFYVILWNSQGSREPFQVQAEASGSQVTS